MHSFCLELDKLLTDPRYKSARIYHYCGNDIAKKANAAFLMGAYEVTYLSRSAKEAWKVFEKEKFVPYRDAARGPCNYQCTLLDCLEGIEWAQKLGWYNRLTFDLSEYKKYERLENGDLSWVIPGKIMAFSTPVDSDQPNKTSFPPEFYIPIFKELEIEAVFRVGAKEYDREVSFEDV
eukprot:TRINITY_DN3347_c0_g1_i1.p1 TRINITY_DN3347_c0_g1~~TRINITY_DN3347_c0_g1_i1.p1  ORF type:complete len:178 (+),score=53.16 TRINITY_DN3347_c0_g1_i1:349-882(+)